MADHQSVNLTPQDQPWQHSVDEARAFARERFKERLENGEQVGSCSCHTEHEAVTALGGDSTLVVGVRFRDSSRMYFYGVDDDSIAYGDWVVVPSTRGTEAARVVISPRQMAVNQLDGDLRPIDRRLTEDDVKAMEYRRDQQASVVRRAGELSRGNNLRIKVIGAEYSLDGSRIKLSYSCADKDAARAIDLKRLCEAEFGTPIDMVSASPRDEARMLGGLGKCGRSLCCSSWLPFYPDVNMGMVKNQDLSLNPSKVTGLCGRLLCCLSYENEQYRSAKRILPRLGNAVSTQEGTGTVISLQVLKELVSVRMHDSNEVKTIPASEVLGEEQRRRDDRANRDGDPQGDFRRQRRGRRNSSNSKE